MAFPPLSFNVNTTALVRYQALHDRLSAMIEDGRVKQMVLS